MTRRAVYLIIVLIVTLIGAWFFSTYERVSDERFTGFQGEARYNQFLGASLVLNELGIDAQSRSSFDPGDWLPGPEDTIVTRVTTSIAVDSQRTPLFVWISSGGHLVLLPPDDESPIHEDFLEALGFRLVDVSDDMEYVSGEEGKAIVGDEDTDRIDYRLELRTTWSRIEVLTEEFQGATLSDEYGIVAARRAWGDGFVTVIAGGYMFNNFNIDEPDHARLLVDIVAGYVDPGVVWFVYSSTFPSLWEEIWNFAPFAVLGFGIALFLWLWSVMPAFGPPIYSEPPPRRSIIEHVQAAGQFAWRNHGTMALAQSSAAAVMHEAEFRHPGIGRLSPEKQAQQLSKMTGMPAQEILDAILEQGVPRPREFTHNMQALHQIRKEL